MPQFFTHLAPRRMRAGGLVLIATLIVVSVTAFVTAAAPTAAPAVPPTAAKTPRATTNVDTAAARLVIHYPAAPGATLDPTHQAIANAEATWSVGVILTATQQPPRSQAKAAPMFPVEPTPTVVTGIIKNVVPPTHSDAYVDSEWRGIEGNLLTVIWAGELQSDFDQGVVLVDQIDLSGPYVYKAPKEIRTPTKHGSVKITTVNGMLLTLQAEDGTIFTFDASALAFV